MKNILHLCADTGSDSFPYQQDPEYNVILIGSEVGVENYSPDIPIHGIFANPVCTSFSRFKQFNPGNGNDPESGLWMVRECQRIIEAANPEWWVIENPATGTLKKYLGEPTMTYEPWHYGSPWTKRTALWGKFTLPPKLHDKWEDVEKIDLYKRPGREKPSLAFLHVSSYHSIPEFSGLPVPKSDSEFRSYCSQKFAEQFKKYNP